MSGWLLVNPRSGVGSAGSPVGAPLGGAFAGGRKDATMVARRARAEALGCAGGDGTVAAVAAVAVERDLPFVCVPFGTRNHFARDLGLDRADPIAALDAFGGTERRIDVGRANGRLFLNNVSIGAYAVLVHRGWRRVLDALRLRHRLTVDGDALRTRVLLIANNAYSLSGARDRLDEGRLHLYTPRGEIRVASRVVVGARSRNLRTAVDGERAVFETPLELAIEPGALRVLVPAAT